MVTALARRLPSTVLALALATGTPGCVLNLGDDDPCAGDAAVAGFVITTVLLDPATLTCHDFGGSPCGCGGCPETPPIPTWGSCHSTCTGLDPQTCSTTAGCRAAWDHVCLLTDAICTLPDNGYYGCFAVDTTGPIQGACDGLDALECSRHDDCLATYRRDQRCANRLDDDGDGIIDEPDECLSFGLCMAESPR